MELELTVNSQTRFDDQNPTCTNDEKGTALIPVPIEVDLEIVDNDNGSVHSQDRPPFLRTSFNSVDSRLSVMFAEESGDSLAQRLAACKWVPGVENKQALKFLFLAFAANDETTRQIPLRSINKLQVCIIPEIKMETIPFWNHLVATHNLNTFISIDQFEQLMALFSISIQSPSLEFSWESFSLEISRTEIILPSIDPARLRIVVEQSRAELQWVYNRGRYEHGLIDYSEGGRSSCDEDHYYWFCLRTNGCSAFLFPAQVCTWVLFCPIICCFMTSCRDDVVPGPRGEPPPLTEEMLRNWEATFSPRETCSLK